MSDERAPLAAGTLIGLGLLGLLGVGIWKLTDWMGQKEQKKQELIDLYLDEQGELMAFQETLASKGFKSDFDDAQLESMEEKMKVKELTINAYNTSWLRDLANAATDAAKGMGLWVILPIVAGSITGGLLAQLWRKRPPRGGPPPSCPVDGLTFSTPEQLETHIRQQHTLNPSPQQIQSAQAIYQSQYLWVQEMVAADSKTYGRAKGDWSQMTSEEQMRMATSMAALATVALVPPLGVAVALLLI